MIQPQRILLGTAAYAAITFPVAYVWHLVVFKPIYDRLGYFSREEPIIAFGFFAILIQGAILSLVYPLLCRGKSFLAGALTLGTVMGVYHWTMHVLAEAAKHPIAPLGTWFLLETAYLLVQFSLASLLVAYVYRETVPSGQR